jgi:ferredoxin
MNRYEEMKSILDDQKYFKVICGAGNEDPEEVKRISIVYTLAGAKGIDISARPEVVQSCSEGIDYAFEIADKLGVNIGARPFITISVGMPGDHHVRKAEINLDTCINCDLCIPVCPTDAIPSSLEVIHPKCIGCGFCSAVCPRDNVIDYFHDEKQLNTVLPKCIEKGAENIELHAGVADSEIIQKEWELICNVNPNNFNSMCLDRLHLSNYLLEERIEMAKSIAKDKLIIQADGYPMSGGEDTFNTTLQAVATADVINKRFNKKLNKITKKHYYLKKIEAYILLSGGTNSLTALLAKQTDVLFNGISVGSYARKIIKDLIESDAFYEKEVIRNASLIAGKLVSGNIT